RHVVHQLLHCEAVAGKRLEVALVQLDMPVGYRTLILSVQPLDLRIGIALKVDEALQFADLSVFKADRMREQLPIAHETELLAPD
ncbi:MAG: hypothetical protein IJV04_03665, partial [Lachnospiraceae bacterium]|nr:hypothetical protein [Lachnospiraceae bacterium]